MTTSLNDSPPQDKMAIRALYQQMMDGWNQHHGAQMAAAFVADGEWRIALFQNTPAQFHGRPELVVTMTEELRQAQ